MRLIACGDSWCWGAELVDPDKPPYWSKGKDNHSLHYIPHHAEYRMKNRYIQLFANKINATDVIDLSLCSYSNDAIVRTLTDWLINEDYVNGKDTADLFISIGWTSPERKEVYFKERWGSENWVQIGPLWTEFAGLGGRTEELETFGKIYINNFWNAGEYMHRWIHQVWQTEMLLKKLNIKYVMHQAFYHHHQKSIRDWDDKIYQQHHADYINTSDKKIWATIDPIRFMHKDDLEKGTAHNYMLNKAHGDRSAVFYEMHPNMNGHKIWANHLYEYCIENKLL